MSDDAFYLTVFGEGSFSLGKDCPTWRGPATYTITSEQAEACLAYKDANPDSNLFVVSATPLDLGPSGKPSWMLRPEDLSWNAEPEPEFYSTLEAEPGDDEPAEPDPDAPGEFRCTQCAKPFTSIAGLRQHKMLNHSRRFEEEEQALRSALDAQKAARAAQERVSQAQEPESVRLRTPQRPNLWPSMPS